MIVITKIIKEDIDCDYHYVLLLILPMLLQHWQIDKSNYHCAKSVEIRSFSGPYFPAFGLNTKIYGVNFRIQSECRKYRQEKLRIWTLFTQYITTIIRYTTVIP